MSCLKLLVLVTIHKNEAVNSFIFAPQIDKVELQQKIDIALNSMRPFLQANRGDVELVEVTEKMEVQLMLIGNCSKSHITMKACIENGLKKCHSANCAFNCHQLSYGSFPFLSVWSSYFFVSSATPVQSKLHSVFLLLKKKTTYENLFKHHSRSILHSR